MVLIPAGHHQAYLFGRCDFRIDLADDLAFADDEQAVGKRGDLFEFSRYKQNGGAGVAEFDQLSVDKFDGTDINAAGRLRNQQQLWIQLKFAADDELLLIAARERFCGVAGLGGRTSKFSMISVTRFCIAELFINPVAAAIGGR